MTDTLTPRERDTIPTRGMARLGRAWQAPARSAMAGRGMVRLGWARSGGTT